MNRYIAVLLAASLAFAIVADAQTVVQALTGLWLGNQGSVQRGAVNLARLSARPPASNVVLPQCHKTDVLLNSGGFPRDWAKLQLQDQVRCMPFWSSCLAAPRTVCVTTCH
jgi:hypothetical protein